MERDTFCSTSSGSIEMEGSCSSIKFDSVFDASKFADICFQRDGVMTGNEGGWSGSEDCLYLNVWTPDWSSDEVKNQKAQS